MWVYVYVYAHTHAHCTYGVLSCEPRGQDETPGGPEESRWILLGIFIFVYAYEVHMCVCMLGGGMRSWTNCCFSSKKNFFRNRKAKDLNANH